ncbi:MAG: Flp pilus assembly complex ATPase component TadA [Candidatus Marinimicrobia bacterium]|jgi:type IV pilus assembly protein PilB|nr:Flp pilus assembly complex ATPase component TadA [Candidatus Neomarinimicrobiota bacterium]MBT3938060.1 Flp pilus assembly complex ATPase component TadA [Candidatus Neomarinimicrobiota bacterium]MBT3961528.1 Flp pilus assembly complex ATPase component TadA [Candidatus Neomarinimicrobiota bacterium]MBT4382084.1 Flp pilus assembly complex ATPase component TadA [Candidatus Neomarinimicrobiota bacterium]MBT4636061.1 Flp pilus assembly complex ATPase component TadA [Candidatus Neomarinimicrobiota
MAKIGKQTIGHLLVQSGKIDENQLSQALKEQKNNNDYLGNVLIEMGALDEKDRNQMLSHQLKIPYLELGHYDVDSSVLTMVPERIVREFNVLPLFLLNKTLNVAVADPLDPAPINAIRQASGLRVDPIIVTATDLGNAIDLHYGMSKFVNSKSENNSPQTNMDDLFDESRVVDLVDRIIEQSQKYMASDIHIEPREEDIRVRFRIDGRLQDFQSLPLSIANALISRLKIMASMDIAESRRPQDGRILFLSKDSRLDLRISTYPTLYGEKSVLRLLNISESIHSLIDLGFEQEPLKQYEEMQVGGEGIILVSGPTGSGKTTTLYSTLNKLETADVNIVTIEDPVEYDLDNINQAQVNPKSGVTFASALRAILRQDPDIVMVGEVRDEETVELAIRAALTGHLVFSTIHTNDAASGFTRLLNWGIEPFLITSTVKGIIAQRLVRRICQACKESYEAEPMNLKKVGLNVNNPITLYRGKGCLSCRNTGYKGRIGIYELLQMDDEIAQLIMDKAPGYKIRENAINKGMITLLEDGLIKAKRGDTSLSEVIETLGSTQTE